ncbi:hypothetical protein G6M26_28125 [Agrobacterium tumefaciens]|nr:hypothetical protein [Agrobacterium tumefaciens]NTE22419.1 hypothetical protein [Agrobacterium tumefaciens]
MKDEDYKPFYLNEIVEVNDGHYILKGYPQYNFNEDLYYEIHIKSNSEYINMIKRYMYNYIFIDLISENELEVYYGEFYSECFSDGEISYTSYLYNKIEKTSKDEWKPKFKGLESKFDALLNQRLPEYVVTRNKVAQNFKQLLKETLLNSEDDKASAFIFGSLHNFPFPDRLSEADLHLLVNPNKELILFKDWKFDHQLLEVKYNNLLNVDLEDYDIIKKHVIDIYKNMFSNMLPNLKYNFKDVDEQKYDALFNSIIKMFDKTEA